MGRAAPAASDPRETRHAARGTTPPQRRSPARRAPLPLPRVIPGALGALLAAAVLCAPATLWAQSPAADSAGPATSATATTAATAATTTTAAPRDGDSLTDRVWFGVRGYFLSVDLRGASYGTCGAPRCDATETYGTGQDLGLHRRSFAGFELAAGLDLRPAYARVGFAAGWDAAGTATVTVPRAGGPSSLHTTGIASVISLSVGLAPRWSRGVVTLGAFVSYVSPTAKLGAGADSEDAAAHFFLGGVELGVEHRVRRGIALSTTVRVGIDLSVAVMLGFAFGGR
jgi:hypothetical protein